MKQEYKTFKDLEFIPHPVLGEGGTRAHMKFDNGFGVSVITGEYAYSDEARPYEVAVLQGDNITYSTPITDDVIGHLNEGGVTEIMRQIQDL